MRRKILNVNPANKVVAYLARLAAKHALMDAAARSINRRRTQNQ